MLQRNRKIKYKSIFYRYLHGMTKMQQQKFKWVINEYYQKNRFKTNIYDNLIEKLILSNSKPRKYLNCNNPINLFLKEVSHLD